MAPTNCWRCLQRPSAAGPAPSRIVPLLMPTAAAFTTSAPLAAKAKSGGNVPSGHQRAGKRMKLGKFKKKLNQDRGKPPLPGERKAFRKRILLSNNNALPVTGLPRLGAASMADPQSAGRVFAVPDQVVDQLRSSEAFKATQPWGLFRSPHVLVRSETVDLARRMQAAAADGKTLRLVVAGGKVTGKSVLLLQAMANAFLNEWIVVNIPEAQELTTACTEYAPIPGTSPVQWMQPSYALRMINAIHKANEPVLRKLKTVRAWDNLLVPLPAGTSLAELSGSAREADSAWPIFTALWAELTAPGHGRPPLLFALDGLSHAMRVSDYRDPAFELIHAHDLHIVRSFVDLLSGAAPLPNGGAVLAAASRSNSPRSPSLELALAQRAAERNALEAVPRRDPYRKGYDDRVDAALGSVEVLHVEGLTKAEARALMEYWAASGLLRAAVNEHTVSEKWVMGGNGVVGEIERATLLNMRL